MKIVIKLLDGKKVPMEIHPELTVDVLKKQLSDKTGVNSVQINLIYKAKPLLVTSKLSEYGIKEGEVVYMMLQLRGGNV